MKKLTTLLVTLTLTIATFLTGCGGTGTNTDKNTYKIAIVKYVDDASLNQIEDAIEAQLKAKEKELLDDTNVK